MIEVLSVASEIYPLVKTGGLADVAGALPKAMSGLGISMRTVVPGYKQVLAALEYGRVAADIGDLFGGPARLIAGRTGELDLIAIEAPHLYEREGGPYLDANGRDYDDNWRRFAALARMGADLGRELIPGYRPQILHAHDWQAGLAPAYLRYGPPTAMKSVLTVHNLAFQGQFSREIFSQLGLPPEAFSMDGVEYYGNVGFLKAGLQLADMLTTVSPTYAVEIRTQAYGMGLDGLLNSRADVLHGILNGIDMAAWDPATDAALASTYDIDSLYKRAVNKAKLEERFGLEPGDGPLFGLVSRLTWQKGIDLVAACADMLVELGGRLCILGSGDAELEQALAAAATRHPGKIAIHPGYDEPLSHLIQGGADAILVPSRFEPCGLTQMFGLRYGCVPVVSRVGGLADTVIDANEAAVQAGVATGVQFLPVDQVGLAEAINRAIALFGRGKTWKRMQRRGMKADVSWHASAQRYAQLYETILGQKRYGD